MFSGNSFRVLSRIEQKQIFGGNGACSYTSLEHATCTCTTVKCRCQSGVGLVPGVMPGCITFFSDGNCSVLPSNDCHGQPEMPY
jgi:hypothetical protein